MKYRYDDLRKRLHAGVVEVTFTKKDGTERVMKCTLNQQHIPEKDYPKGDGPMMAPSNGKVISCYDIENQGWRSFIVENVKHVQ